MLKLFKLVAVLEGISSILLFFVAMPMKYIFDYKQLIKPFGMFHGVFFTIFVAFALYFAFKEKWQINKILVVLVCSIIPCGTFYVDKKYLNHA